MGENLDVSQRINQEMFDHSFSYQNITLAEKMERFKRLFDCQVICNGRITVRLKTRATLRTVIALWVNPFTQVIIRRQPTWYMSIVVQGLFIIAILQQARTCAQHVEKKVHEMSLWFHDSILFKA